VGRGNAGSGCEDVSAAGVVSGAAPRGEDVTPARGLDFFPAAAAGVPPRESAFVTGALEGFGPTAPAVEPRLAGAGCGLVSRATTGVTAMAPPASAAAPAAAIAAFAPPEAARDRETSDLSDSTTVATLNAFSAGRPSRSSSRVHDRRARKSSVSTADTDVRSS
jgi:hypothetical protein